MDQEKGAGHHAITRAAVHEFFASGRATGNPPRIDGMTEDEYFRALDAAQEHQDRLIDTTDVSIAGHHFSVPSGTGPTTHSAWSDGAAQREHGMADPTHTGQWNLDTDRQYVEDQVAASRGGDQMAHLGAAAHALEDSYSEAHVWRDDSADHGDPTAPVQSFNVFDPTPGAEHGGVRTGGIITGVDETHDARFDQVPVDAAGNPIHGSDQAAVHATAQMLESAYDTEHQSDTDARAHVHETVQRFYRAAPDGVGVNIGADTTWEAERDRRLAEHQQEDDAAAAASAPPPTDQELDGGLSPGGTSDAGTE